jgi:iron complex transport system substrate-binding protein
MAYAVGAGDRLVGAVEFSDYPPAASALPRVGDAFRVDYEAMAALAPDLVLAWQTGNPPALIDRLRSLGYRVVALEPASLDGVAEQMLQIGRLAGTEDRAAPAAAGFRRALEELRDGYQQSAPLRVFYQVAREPLFTVTDRHVIGQVIVLCGGRNVFGGLGELTPVVSLEAVLETAPDVILIGGPPAAAAADRAAWEQWSGLPAVLAGQVHAVDADLLSRPGPRLADGAARVCELLARARAAAGSQS